MNEKLPPVGESDAKVIDIQTLYLRDQMKRMTNYPLEEKPKSTKARGLFHRIFSKVKGFLCRLLW